jgi:hypothetical protein
VRQRLAAEAPRRRSGGTGGAGAARLPAADPSG